MGNEDDSDGVTDEQLHQRVLQYLADEGSAADADAFREVADRCITAAHLSRDVAFEMRVNATATVDDPVLGGFPQIEETFALDAARAHVFADDVILLGEYAPPIATRIGLELPPAFFSADLLAPGRWPSKDFRQVYDDRPPEHFDQLGVLFRKLADHLRVDANRCDPRPLAASLRDGDPLDGGRLPKLKKRLLAAWAREHSVGWMRIARVVVSIQYPEKPEWFCDAKAQKFADSLKRM